MYARLVLVAVVGLGLGSAASAVELTSIPRTIAREPIYQSPPGYCLLVFGPEAKTRIWLVKAGPVLYIDYNGNGDLTEPQEKITSPGGSYFTTGALTEKDGTSHGSLHVGAAPNNTFRLRLGTASRRQFVGYGLMERPTWGTQPANAPIIHFNGPLSLVRYGPLITLPRTTSQPTSRRYKLRLMIGTPGLGQGTFASYDEQCSENLGAIQADIVFPSAKPSEPVERRVELLHDG